MCVGLFMQFTQLPRLWRISKIDLCIWVMSFIFTVVLGVREGLIASVGLALMTTVLRAQRPPAVLLGKWLHV
jgi:MFS superfamily sulfate permease-like transporter